jgi:hypothetical protein
MSPERLHQLFVLNVALQIFDGVATYQGLHLAWGEGNPLLVASLPYFGVTSTLLLFKAKACGFLFLLRQAPGSGFVYDSLVVLASVYTFFSFIPWMTRLVSLVAV